MRRERRWGRDTGGTYSHGRVGSPLKAVDLDLALHGGEDYELLFTAPESKKMPSRIVGTAITLIGHITPAARFF